MRYVPIHRKRDGAAGAHHVFLPRQAMCSAADPLRGGSDGRAKGVSLRRKQRPPPDKVTNVKFTDGDRSSGSATAAGSATLGGRTGRPGPQR